MAKYSFLESGQNIEERTESSLLDKSFDLRFLMFEVYNLEHRYDKFDFSKKDTEKKKYAENALFFKPSQSKLEFTIMLDPMCQRINSIVTDEIVREYISQGPYEEQAMFASQGATGTIFRLHEKVEIYELYKSYEQFCNNKSMTPANIEEFLKVKPQSSAQAFFQQGGAKAKERAHKKALIAEQMFIYHLSKSLGYELSFSALVDAHPLRSSPDEDGNRRFVKSFCHGFRKAYSEEEFKAAQRFYKDIGVDGMPGGECVRYESYATVFAGRPPADSGEGSLLTHKLKI